VAVNCLFLNGLNIAADEKFITSGIAGNAITALKPSQTSIPLKTSRYGTTFSPHCWSHSSKGISVKAAHRNIHSNAPPLRLRERLAAVRFTRCFGRERHRIVRQNRTRSPNRQSTIDNRTGFLSKLYVHVAAECAATCENPRCDGLIGHPIHR
jgi:hypothetical protein